MPDDAADRTVPRQDRQDRHINARQFVDSTGTAWHVFERRRDRYDRRATTILVFESSVSVRVVRDYPANWRELEGEALEYLSWKV